MIPTTTQWEAGYFEELAKQRRASKALTDALKRIDRLQLRVAELERVNRELRAEVARASDGETRLVVSVDVHPDGSLDGLREYFDKAVIEHSNPPPRLDGYPEPDVRGVPAPTVDLHGGGIEPGRD